ncbi:MAG TPA: hypothetical protein VFV18_03755 [Porticoccaceae bacterium]|nr:hypothetical protein [Porticoccaceae bacterium]
MTWRSCRARLLATRPALGHNRRHPRLGTGMADILDFKPRPPRRLGLCQYGHHAWQISKDRRFDVKSGKLVTHFRCTRCGAIRVEGT